MNLTKSAQYNMVSDEFNFDGVSLPAESLMLDDSDQDLDVDEKECMYVDDNMMDSCETPDESMLVDEKPMAFVFELPAVPGGDDQEEIAEIEVEDEEDIEVEYDAWKWTIKTFPEWLHFKMQNIPRHSGRDSVGLERVIAFLEALNREISKAVRSDYNNELDVAMIEKARDEIHKGIERCQDRLDKILSTKYPKRKGNKKKSDANNQMIKEGSKGAYYGHITVTIPILISGIARACINSMVSAGKDIEDEFNKLAKQYDLDKREEFMLYQTLSDMGYHVRRPRGTERDEKVDYTTTENTGWIQNFPG